ncbi:LysM and putative peptidoglycan-binding domain-containing protein [Actinidia chinensis var. chinensis]|uniref:LysM and putative peptidoglycan-binding domain-containing protein n=1 Tax=Actinidia chinensis var. chinensis TaxID=1590841 RepID=A0A2R6PBH6_ACTCC|nr:LysM and putative peptidoglycan-binding domain-containing protein [Actinidia chinensis var. chinensis]
MERGRHDNGDYHFFHHHQALDRVSPERMPLKSPVSSSLSVCPSTPLPPSCSPGGASVGGGALSYIEHRVSRMDTLAGVAIKYGVEVADIKRLNGLLTDLQMFALKSLQIPLPGRHTPSPIMSNGLENQGPSSSEGTPPHRRYSDLFESFQSLKLNSSPQQRVSPAMSKLQVYYGLKTTDQKPASEGFEMAVYRKGGSHYLEDGPFAQSSHLSNPPLSHHRKSRSIANGFLQDNSVLIGDMGVTEAKEIESDIWNEKLIRRRQKSEADFSSRTTPEMLLKEDNSGGGFSTITGKGLALRPKAASRTASGVDADANLVNPVIPLSFGDSLVADGINGVRKSSSTSSLQDQESNGISSSIWPTSKWSLKPDLQAFSTAAIITRPIFDGLPKPITGRRNKAALD